MDEKQELPDRQEMFDRAWKGLKAQGFERSTVTDDAGFKYCAYQCGTSKRCAWGWVDMSLNSENSGAVTSMHSEGVGLAGRMHGFEIIEFARPLQNAHDKGTTPEIMEKNLRDFANEFNLLIPED